MPKKMFKLPDYLERALAHFGNFVFSFETVFFLYFSFFGIFPKVLESYVFCLCISFRKIFVGLCFLLVAFMSVAFCVRRVVGKILGQ